MSNPSLLLIPDRYKASKLYSQIPDSGAGDLSFTRVGDTATRVNSEGLIEPVLADIPRIDYTGGGCGKLLLEPQRTNLARASEDFSNLTYWLPTNVTITANQTISPDGTQNADLANFTVGANAINQGNVFAGNSDVTISVFVKANTISIFRIRESFYSGVSCVFDLSAQTAGAGGKLENYGNGWFRCSFTYNLGVGQTNINWIFDSNTAGGSLYLWGAQAEAGSYPTSYIPTLGASVTRGADLASKTGISSLIGVNGGSILIELDANGVDLTTANYVFDLSDGVDFDRNRIAMYWTGANDLNIFYGYGGTFASVIYNFNFLTTKKIGVRWTSTQIQVVVNGVAQTAVTYGNSSPTKLNLASRFNNVEPLSSNIKACALYNNTLSAAELETLTTL